MPTDELEPLEELDETSEAPEKTGPARLLEILGQECAAILKLNLLFVLSCIPLVTIPPALFAMNQVVRRMIKDQPVRCLRHYAQSFRENFGRSYGAFFLVALPLVCAGFGMWFYLGYAAENPLFYVPFVFCSTVFLEAVLSAGYLYGLMGEGRPLKEALRLALLLGGGKPLRSLLAALCTWVPLAAAVLLFPLSGLYLLLIGFVLPCLTGNFFLRTVLRRCCGV